MRNDIHIFIGLIVFTMLIVGCGSNLEENESTDKVIEVTSSRMNSQKEIFIKSKQMIKLALVEKEENVDKNKEESASEGNTKKEVAEKEEKSITEEEPTYTTEEISGDFMSTIALNIRKGPSTDFQLVGNLQPYMKAVASEKATLNGSTWYKVTSNDLSGWAAANYLVAYEKKKTEETKETEETKKTTPKKKTEEKPNKKEGEPAKQKKEESKKSDSKAKETSKEKSKETSPNTSVTPSTIEKAVIDLTNAEREKAGLAPYKIDKKLVASARAKANDMATNNYFAHNSPTYGSAGDQLGQFGVSFSGWGENIAKGHQSAEQVVSEWMNSPGHKENILNPKMTHIGVGYDSNGNYWTQQFIYK